MSTAKYIILTAYVLEKVDNGGYGDVTYVNFVSFKVKVGKLCLQKVNRQSVLNPKLELVWSEVVTNLSLHSHNRSADFASSH